MDSDSPGSSTLAITTVTFNQMTGEIYDADIEVNGSKPISTSEEVPANAYRLTVDSHARSGALLWSGALGRALLERRLPDHGTQRLPRGLEWLPYPRS